LKKIHNFLEKIVRTKLSQEYIPEFINRIDMFVYFKKISKFKVEEILKVKIKEILNEYTINDKNLKKEIFENIFNEFKNIDSEDFRELERNIREKIDEKLLEIY
jgi:ATP-dependent Clp protease ATP-binding subunit ClpA